MKISVLVVEDDSSLREALRDKLSRDGFTVLEAKDGEEGLAIAEREHPALILLDILMPKMNGIEMGKRVREQDWGKTIPILILTNLSDPKDIGQALESGIFNYFIKSDTSLERIVDEVRKFTNMPTHFIENNPR